MPPDISVGPTAPASGAPPGTPAGPLLPASLSASLFAAFLAQSEPLRLKADAQTPNTGAKPPLPIRLTAPPINLQPALKTAGILKTGTLKTMDTLPALSFPPAPKAKDKASELLLPLTPTPSAPSLAVPLAAVPIIAVPLAAVFAPPALSPAPSAVLPVPPSIAAANAAAPTPVASGVSLAAPPAVLMLPQSNSALPTMPALARAETPAPTAAPLPRVFTLTPPARGPIPAPAPASPVSAPAPALAVQTPPVPPTSEPGNAPAPIPARILDTQPPAPTMADALPQVASPVQTARQQPVVQTQLGPPAQAAPTPPQPSATALAAPAAVTAAAVLSSAFPIAASLGAELPKPAPAKTAGKSLAPALKPAGGTADTSTSDTFTRTAQAQTQAVAAKTATPELSLPVPEKHADEHDPAVEASDGGIGRAVFALPAATETGAAKAAAGPLSAAERADVVTQAAAGVGAMPLPTKPGAAEQMSLQLHPKDWGRLQVSVTVAPGTDAGAAKTVTAHIVAETPQVKAALQSGTGALHQALRASGLHLEHLTVSVKPAEIKAFDAPTPAPTARADTSSQPGNSFGQPNTSGGSGANGFGTGFGAGGWQQPRQNPPPLIPDTLLTEPSTEDAPPARTAARPTAGRIDTRA